MDMTICQALCLKKAVEGRLGELSSLRSEVSGSKRYFEPKKVVEPNYDVVSVDENIAGLRQWLFVVDAQIKASNAVTKINAGSLSVSELLKPIVRRTAAGTAGTPDTA